MRFVAISHRDALSRGLKVMDATAISLCMDNKLPIIVFELLREGNIQKVVAGEPIGTLVHADDDAHVEVDGQKPVSNGDAA